MPEEDPKDRPVVKRYQFRLATLFLLTALMSFVAAGFGGMFRHAGEGAPVVGRYILITLIAPVGLVIVFGLIRLVVADRNKRGPRL